MDPFMPTQEPIAQIVPTIIDPQSIGFPQTVLPIDSELSQTSTDSELNYPFSHLSTTSPQSQHMTHTPVMSHSPQMSPFDPNSSQVSRRRMHSMSYYETQRFTPEQRPTGRLSFDEASHQTIPELPRFGQIFSSETGFNTGISQLYNPSMVANQPMQSSCAINITPQHSNTIIHSYSVPTYSYVSDNRSDFSNRSISEPELHSSQTITPYVRRVGAGAALKRREAEDLLNSLENHNYSLKEVLENLQQQVNYYKAMLPSIPTQHFYNEKEIHEKNFIFEKEIHEKNFISEEEIHEKNFIFEKEIHEKNFISEKEIHEKNFISEEEIHEKNFISEIEIHEKNFISEEEIHEKNFISEIEIHEKNFISEKIKESHKINEIMKRNTKLLFVFNNNVILVTDEDKVFCSGSNSHGVLGFGHQKSITEFTINEDLNNKQIIDLKNSLFHTVALNIHGKLYDWGYKLSLLDGKRDNKIYKPTLNEFLIDEIIDFCCGSYHILVLTINNEVYAWGANDFGQIGNASFGKTVSMPSKVNGFNGEKVKAISTGSYHSMALTESGCVYSWGYNKWGQLGINNSKYKENQPKRIFIEVEISKIICGPEHSLFLSHEGDIYVMGNNEFGQLGLSDDRVKQLTPKKISHSQKFVEIASHYRYDISAALSKDGLYYVWGECGEEGIISERKETTFKSFNEIFVHYWKITYKVLNYCQQSMN